MIRRKKREMNKEKKERKTYPLRNQTTIEWKKGEGEERNKNKKQKTNSTEQLEIKPLTFKLGSPQTLPFRQCFSSFLHVRNQIHPVITEEITVCSLGKTALMSTLVTLLLLG